MPEQVVVPTRPIPSDLEKSKHERVKEGREINSGTTSSDQDIRQKQEGGEPEPAGGDMLACYDGVANDGSETESNEKETLISQHEKQSDLLETVGSNFQEITHVDAEEWPTPFDDALAIARNGLKPLPGDINKIQEQVETSGKIIIRSITWNQQAQELPSIETLREDLFSPGYFHVVAVGTQECEKSISKSILYPCKDNWERICGEALGSDYELVRGHSLQASHLVVFVHRAILNLVSDVKSVAVATGLCDKLGNKGGIAIAMKLGKSKLCFLTAHLAAHQAQMDRRTAEFVKISREVSRSLGEQDLTEMGALTEGEGELEDQDEFEDNCDEGTSYCATDSSHGLKCCICSKCPSSVRKCSICCYSDRSDAKHNPLPETFDQIIWGGDFNFRINGTRDIVDSLLLHNRCDVLLDNDQLRMLMQFDKAFIGFVEGPLTFRPTYKFDKKSDVYDTSAKRRIPAWTDRMLYKPNSSIQLLSYASVVSVRSSDHRPVVASFQCSLDLEEKGSRDVRMPLLRSESKSEVCVIS